MVHVIEVMCPYLQKICYCIILVFLEVIYCYNYYIDI
jgi:hypothetical protein